MPSQRKIAKLARRRIKIQLSSAISSEFAFAVSQCTLRLVPQFCWSLQFTATKNVLEGVKVHADSSGEYLVRNCPVEGSTVGLSKLPNIGESLESARTAPRVFRAAEYVYCPRTHATFRVKGCRVVGAKIACSRESYFLPGLRSTTCISWHMNTASY
jgi:hypothetical protein